MLRREVQVFEERFPHRFASRFVGHSQNRGRVIRRDRPLGMIRTLHLTA